MAPTGLPRRNLAKKKGEEEVMGFIFLPEPIAFLHCKIFGKRAPQPEFSGKH